MKLFSIHPILDFRVETLLELFKPIEDDALFGKKSACARFSNLPSGHPFEMDHFSFEIDNEWICIYYL